MKMKKKLVERVINEKIVDTNRYRYCYCSEDGVIKRININYLNTTLTLNENNWVIVWRYKKSIEFVN